MITQADGARLIYAAGRWAQKAQTHGMFITEKTELAERRAMESAERAFAELVQSLTEQKT